LQGKFLRENSGIYKVTKSDKKRFVIPDGVCYSFRLTLQKVERQKGEINKYMKKIVLGMMLAAALTLTSYAGEDVKGDAKDLKSPITNQGVEEPWFHANEWQADVFATYSDVLRRTSGAKFYSDGFGGGIGGNYYFTKYIGFGVEGFGWDANHGGVGSIVGNFLFRYPLEEWHLAPYALIGGGYDFGNIGTWKGNFGAGIEYRFTRHWGVFADGRYVLVDNGSVNNYNLARLGVRYSF
jgi:hypothetical protein